MEFQFPQGFSLGVSSAATQIEGGNTDHSWNDWYRKGHITDGSDPAASAHWERWQEDTDLLSSMGIPNYRLGVEWSRLVPQPGKPDEAAIAQYRQELSALLDRGIRPLLTIHHFSNPMWFEKKGAFLKRENLQDYLDLVKLVVERFGDLVSEYITINEPNVYATNGYLFGQWPPGRTSYRETFQVLENMAYCHIKAYEMIHSMREAMGFHGTKVGFANHVRVFDPKNPRNPLHRLFATVGEWAFQGAISRAMTLGQFRFPLKNHWNLPKGAYADFIGINYYTRSTVSGLADGVRANSPRNDLDWEIYPEGLIRCAEKLTKLLPRPIWVTENGTCDRDDRFRAKYICDHLKVICDSDLPFRRYYHWCFCDNFEWIEGVSARFGLVHVDHKTQERTVKASGRFYAALSKAGGMTEDLYQQYVQGEVYDVR